MTGIVALDAAFITICVAYAAGFAVDFLVSSAYKD